MRFFIFALVMAGMAFGDSLTITNPKAGDVLYVGDTLFVDYVANQTYLDASNGILISVSVNNGKSFGDLHPAMKAELNINTIYPHDSTWGHVPVVIPDSIKPKTGTTNVSSISDSVRFKVKDYAGSPYAITGMLSIKPASTKPVPVQTASKSGCGKGAGLAFLVPLLLPGSFRKFKKWRKFFS